MYLALGQGVGNMCVAGDRNGPVVNITGQGWDMARNCPRDSESEGCGNYSGQRRVFKDAADKNLFLNLKQCAGMEVTHAGESLTANLTNCSVSLNLQASKSNTITVGANGTARLNVERNCGPVTITMSGSPSVTKDPNGSTYSIEGSNGEFITLNAAQISQVKLNGKSMKSYLPADPAGSADTSGATGVTGAATTGTNNVATGADIISGRNRNGLNGGSTFGNTQSLRSQSSGSQSNGSLTTDPPLSKTSGAANGVVGTTVANVMDPAPKSSMVNSSQTQQAADTLKSDAVENQQATKAEIDAKKATNAASQANSGAGTPAAQSMFGATMPMMFQFIYMLMGIFQEQGAQQQGAQQNQPLSRYQKSYLPWW